MKLLSMSSNTQACVKAYVTIRLYSNPVLNRKLSKAPKPAQHV